jgi:hypothetical protein
MRRAAALVLVVLAAGCGGGGKQTPPVRIITGSPPIRVVFHGQDHHPRAGKRWSYEVRVTDRDGNRVSARIHLQILFGGVAVGQVGVHRVRNGAWRETLGTPGNPPFPAAARGRRLVFQTVVTARGVTVKRNWPIVVR